MKRPISKTIEYMWICENNLKDRLLSDLNIIECTLEKCNELYKNRKTNNFSIEYKKEYTWLYNNNLLNEFKKMNVCKKQIKNHSLERCVELYNKKTDRFQKEYINEYNWLNRNKLLGEFNKLTKCIKQIQNHSLERCIELYKNKKTNNFSKEYDKEYAWLLRNNLLNEFKIKIKS